MTGAGVAGARPDAYASFRIPAFRLFIASLLAMTLAVQIQGVVVAWQVYALTRDPLSLGLVGLAEAVPFLLTALPAGQWADRIERRRLATGAIAVLVACSLALLALTASGALVPRPDGLPPRRLVWLIYAVLGVSGVARAVLQPARQALGADLVPIALYPNAATWRSTVWQGASVVGPALGGLLFALVGATWAYALDSVLLAVAVVAMSRMRPQHERPRTGVHAAGGGMLEGVRFVLRDRVVLAALSLDLFGVLFGGATALLPVFTAEVLRVAPVWLGWLRAAPACGAVLMAFALAHLPPMHRPGRLLLGAVACYGLTVIGFALSRDPWLSFALLAVGGCVDAVSVVIRSTLLQVRTPPAMMGRVMAVNSVFIGSANEIGAFDSGVAATWLGTVPSVVAGGVATLVVVTAVGVLAPQLRALRDLHTTPVREDADAPATA